jgi:hypothetical protein
MYVCPKCNSLVDQPQKRWWSGYRYCPNGHVLYVHGLGASLEKSFSKSFLKSSMPSIIVFCLIVLTFAVAPDYPPNLAAHRGAMAASIGISVAFFYLFWGLMMLGKARSWAGREGAVQRLVTHARGKAYGFLTSVLCQLGIVIALLLAR